MAVRHEASRRFSNLLSRCSQLIWDTVLYEDDDVLIVPTLGSLVPDWLLVIPKADALNFSIWSEATGRNALDLVQAIHRHISNESTVIWFEHGAYEYGSEVGCGVDHAHIHLLLRPSFDLTAFRQVASELSQMNWLEGDSDSPYSTPITQSHYYAFGDFNRNYLHTGHMLGRQFFRKVVAQLIGRPDEWDYRKFDGLENVKETVSQLEESTVEAA